MVRRQERVPVGIKSLLDHLTMTASLTLFHNETLLANPRTSAAGLDGPGLGVLLWGGHQLLRLGANQKPAVRCPIAVQVARRGDPFLR